MKHIITTALSVLFCIGASAQSFGFINFPVSPTQAALGGAGLALDADGFAVDVNPAAMSLSDKRLSAQADYQMLAPSSLDLKMVGAGAFYRIKSFSFGLSGRFFTEPSYDVISSSAKVTGSYTPRHVSLALGLAYAFSDRISAGLSARYLSFSFAEGVDVKTPSFDVSAEYSTEAFSAVLAIKNLSHDVSVGKYNKKYYKIPSYAAAGLSYSLAGFSATAEFDCMFSGSIMAGIGAQYELFDIVDLRAGYHYGNGTDAIPQYLSAGLGVHVIGIEFNAAAMFSRKMGTSLSFGLGYSF